jgi:hypothetical protein
LRRVLRMSEPERRLEKTVQWEALPFIQFRTNNFKLAGRGSGTNRKEKKALGIGQYLFEWCTPGRPPHPTPQPGPNTPNTRTAEKRFLYCADDLSFCTHSSRWPTLSRQSEIPTLDIRIPQIPSKFQVMSITPYS